MRLFLHCWIYTSESTKWIGVGKAMAFRVPKDGRVWNEIEYSER